MIDVGIVGVGTYLPEKTMKAAEIARLTNGVWSEDAVINKLGIKQRYLPGPDDGTQEMGAKAALKCLENTGVDPKEIDVILCIGEEWKDCDVVIIAGNQTYFQAAYTAMQTANVRKPVITSYVNIAPATVPNEATSAEASDIYGGAWVIIDDSADERQKADLLRFIAICDWGVEKGIISRSTADSYLISAYAMSSFIALDVFMTGIDRLADKEITREAFLEAMESAPINVPISGGVNYANGQRIGLDGMSFVKYVRPTEAGAAASTGTFVNVVGMQSIDQILGELDDAE